MNSRRRRGFTLTEFLFSLSLLAVFSMVAGRVFHNVFTLFRQTEIAESRLSAYDSAVHRLRKDVWSASRIEVPDPMHVYLSFNGGQSITWSLDSAGGMLRTENSNPPTRWDANALHLRFGQETATLLFADPAEDPALATRLTSQVILGRGAP